MSSTISSDEASTDNYTDDALQLGALVISIVITLVLAFLERNKNGKRPGLVIPLDFLHDDRLAYVYAAAFGCTAFQVTLLIFQRDQFATSLNIPKLVYPWIRALIWLLMAVLVAFKYYPLFAVIRCKRLIVEPLIGLVYGIYLFAIFMYELISSLSILPSSYTASIIAYVPIIVCYVLMLVYFTFKLYRHLQKFMTGNNQPSNKNSTHHQRQYVKWLLEKPGSNLKENAYGENRRIQSLIRDLKCKLELTTPLRASPRVISTFAVAALVIFELAIILVILYPHLRQFATRLLNVDIEADDIIKTFFTVADVGFYLSFTISGIMMIVYICILFIQYRKDLVKMHRGDFSFFPIKLRKQLNDNLVAASLRYSGLQIAYLLWCYVLVFLLLWIGCIAVAYLIILPLAGKVPFDFFHPFLTIFPIIIINLGFRKLQVFLSNKFFLQDYTVEIPGKSGTQKALAINNVKTFNILTFFAFFYNAIIGFFSCISRILIGLLIGLISLARIDRPMLPVGYEKYDKGYSTYVGMIMVELYHRNPILIVFCDELLLSQIYVKNCLLEPVRNDLETTNTNIKRHRQIRRRWQKTYTMLKNPSVRRLVVQNEPDCSIVQVTIAV